jgi:hypothetical protein
MMPGTVTLRVKSSSGNCAVMSHAVLARGWQITAAFLRIIVCTVFFSFYKFFSIKLFNATGGSESFCG